MERPRPTENFDSMVETLSRDIRRWGEPPVEGAKEARQKLANLRTRGKLTKEQTAQLDQLGLEAIDPDMF